MTHTWDLDGDGAFDDGAGATVTMTAAGSGTRRPSARPTPAAVSGSERRTFAVHAANARPTGRLRLVSPVPGAATTTEVVVDASDPDGHVATIEFDIHDDGEYEVTEAFAPGEVAHAEHGYHDPVRRAALDARADHRRRGRDHGSCAPTSSSTSRTCRRAWRSTSRPPTRSPASR